MKCDFLLGRAVVFGETETGGLPLCIAALARIGRFLAVTAFTADADRM